MVDTERVARTHVLSGGAVSLLGGLLLAVPVWDMWDDVTNLSWGVLATVVENSPLLLLSLGLVAGGGWLATRDWEPRYVASAARWNLGVVAGVGVLYAWIVALQLWAMHSLKPWVLLLDGILVSGVVAFVVGVYDARGRMYADDLERQEAVHRSLTDDVLDTSNVAMLVLDESLAVVWANRTAGEYLGVDPDAVVGREVRDVVADVAPALESPERFEAHLERTYGRSDTASIECHLTGDDGTGERWLEHTSQPIESGYYAGGRIEHFTDITEQKRAQQELATRERTLRELYDVVSAEGQTLAEKVETVVDVGRDLLDADHGSYTTHGEATPRLETRHGDDAPHMERRCREQVAGNTGLWVESRPFEGGTGTDGTRGEFAAYAGRPVHDDDGVHGALCFAWRAADRSPDDWQRAVVELMGDWVGYELQREQLQSRLRRELEEREQKLGSFVQAVDEYAVFRVDADRGVASWNSGAEAITGYDREEALDCRLDAFFVEGGAAEEVVSRATETGTAEYEGWWTRRDGERFWVDLSLTARSAGDGTSGVVAIARDMTTEREYERTIEAERERLEFLNRVLRHNLLNGLNVVGARAAIVEREVEAADENVAVIRQRVEEMTDLIDRIRSFADAVTGDHDHELSAVPLRDAIEEQVEQVATTHDDARVAVHDLPAESVRVLGDSLFDVTLENILTNAVVHSDEPVPRVEVWTSESTVEAAVDTESGAFLGRADGHATGDYRTVAYPAVTVHVADNGPGIPAEERCGVREKGRSRLNEPGHGFGLYLVTEMMDTYGGTIEFRDNDPKGTVVELTFPLARPDTDGATTGDASRGT